MACVGYSGQPDNAQRPAISASCEPRQVTAYLTDDAKYLSYTCRCLRVTAELADRASILPPPPRRARGHVSRPRGHVFTRRAGLLLHAKRQSRATGKSVIERARNHCPRP
jgi:hypothetical protein